MNTTTSLIVVLLLLATNGFFVAAEFALVKSRNFRLTSLAASGSASARLTVRIQENLEAYLAACQLGITMASLGLGWVGEPVVAHLLEPLFRAAGLSEEVLHTASFVAGFLIFSSLHIVVGEQVPKTFAIRKPEPVAMWAAYPLHFAYILVWPLNYLLNKTSGAILRLFGVADPTHGDVMTGEELRGVVDTSQLHGELHVEKADMLRNLLDFDERQVERVLIPRASLKVLDVQASSEQNLAIIKDTAHSRFPVIDSADNDRIVGMLLVKDLQHAILSGEPEPWADIAGLCRDPLIVPENKLIAELFNEMRSNRAHMTLVIDEYGTFVGIVTLEDLLEEIVGEIHDENDQEHSIVELTVVSDNEWQAGGLVSIDDLYRTIGLPLAPESDVNTLTGLFMNKLARVPVEGDQIKESDFLITVESIVDHRVGIATITRHANEDGAADEDRPD